MENRKGGTAKSNSLPADYLRLVAEVFNTNFDAGLQALEKVAGQRAWFDASGTVFPTEVVLCLTLFRKDQLSATSVYGSCDFDPKASSPTLEDLLKASVDAIGLVFLPLLDPEKPEQLERLADDTLSTLNDVPFHWTEVDAEKRKIFVKIDKSNPALDRMTEEWLSKNDPERRKHVETEQKKTEELFFTGPKNKTVEDLTEEEEEDEGDTNGSGSSSVH